MKNLVLALTLVFSTTTFAADGGSTTGAGPGARIFAEGGSTTGAGPGDRINAYGGSTTGAGPGARIDAFGGSTTGAGPGDLRGLNLSAKMNLKVARP